MSHDSQDPHPEVTVIVPMYNVGRYVGECLQSLVKQKFEDFEVICVDDGSVDDTLSIAKASVEGDDRFVFMHQENQGQSAARNAALGRASGSYVLFLDSDDMYRPLALDNLVRRMREDKLDILFFSAETFYESAELRRTHNENQGGRSDIHGIMTGEQLYIRMEETGSFRPSACLFMMSAKLIEDNGLRFKEGIIHEDLLFTLTVFPLAARAGFLNAPLYRRRMREGSTMTSERGMRNIAGLFCVWRGLESWLATNNQSYSDAFCDCYAHRVFDTENDLSRDMLYVGQSAVEGFREGLDRDDRLAFDYCWEHAQYMDRAIHDVADSKTFKVGRAIMAIPSWVKGRLVPPS